MNEKFDLRLNVPTLISLVSLIIAVGVDIGMTRQCLQDHQRQIDEVKMDERHDRELIEKFGQIAMATQSVNATLSEFVNRMPPVPPRGHPPQN
jgi:hypothetical protein